MLKTPENNQKFKPLHLFKAKINSKKDAFFFITDSDKEFWMKQEPTDWEKITIDSMEVLRDGGTTTYYFNGKEYDELYIPSSFKKNEKPYISGNHVSKVELEKIPLSKEILKGIDISKLDLLNIPETLADVEKKKKEKDSSTGKNLSRLFHSNLGEFFGVLSADTQESSASGVSTVSDINEKKHP